MHEQNFQLSKSFRCSCAASQARVKVICHAPDSWTEVERPEQKLTKLVFARQCAKRVVTCQSCGNLGNRRLYLLQKAAKPDNSWVLCEGCLRCSCCLNLIHKIKLGSLFIHKVSPHTVQLVCRPCFAQFRGPCIVCSQPTTFDTMQQNFSVQFCSLKDFQKHLGHTRSDKCVLRQRKPLRPALQLTSYSIHSHCLKCVNCNRGFSENQACFLHWKDADPTVAGYSKAVFR